MIILGIHSSFTGLTHDSSACLIKDGKVLAAIEEEKLIRVKSASTYFPINSIKSCLKIANININKVDLLVSDGATYPPIKNKIKNSMIHFFGMCPKIEIYNHAFAHVLGSFFSSGFEKSLIISIDGSGDRISSMVCFGEKEKNKTKIKKIYSANYTRSLGNFYTAFTNFLGFKSIEGEYKLMGMAAYGKTKFNLSSFINFNKKNGKIEVGKDYKKIFNIKNYSSINEPSYSKDFICKKFNIKRPKKSKIFSQCHYDLAASVQHQFQKTYLNLIEYYIKKTKAEYLCLSGGCALNCLANKELIKKKLKGIYVMPAASDRGLSLGTAMICANKYNEKIEHVKSMFLGNAFSKNFVQKELKNFGIKYKKIKNHYKDCARELQKGKVIGWFQGRAEFGPRALGARSIIANPKKKGMKDKLNSKIKFREKYRPFAPSVLDKSFYKYHDKVSADLSSMTFTIDVPKKLKYFIPEAVHFDNTSRVHLVDKNNLSLHRLLVEIEKINNFGAVINTSFNLSGEPNVDTPSDALRTFFSSGIDLLYIENFKIEKLKI